MFTSTIISSFHFHSSHNLWSISYIIDTHSSHGNIWTHNWRAPNVSGFIAQLVEHCTGIARSWVQTPLMSWIFFSAFFTQLHKLRSLQRSFLHFISFPRFTYDLFHIQCSPYEAVTGKIYRLKQHLLPPAPLKGLQKLNIFLKKMCKLWSNPILTTKWLNIWKSITT